MGKFNIVAKNGKGILFNLYQKFKKKSLIEKWKNYQDMKYGIHCRYRKKKQTYIWSFKVSF